MATEDEYKFDDMKPVTSFKVNNLSTLANPLRVKNEGSVLAKESPKLSEEFPYLKSESTFADEEKYHKTLNENSLTGLLVENSEAKKVALSALPSHRVNTRIEEHEFFSKRVANAFDPEVRKSVAKFEKNQRWLAVIFSIISVLAGLLLYFMPYIKG